MKHSLYQGSAFNNLSKATARWTGHPLTFLLALTVIITWLITGPIFHFSDTWQLVINTGTTIVTFLMVFLIQNTQNRDSYAIQLKLDELIRCAEGAHNSLLDIEEMTEEELIRLKSHYLTLAKHARENLRQGKTDIDRPDVEM
jgi:low affinity Fe/Cu permease